MKYTIKLNNNTIAKCDSYEAAYAVAADYATLAIVDAETTSYNLDCEVGATAVIGVSADSQAVTIEVVDNKSYIDEANAAFEAAGIKETMDKLVNLIEINERIKAFNAKRQVSKKQEKDPDKSEKTINEKGYKVGDYVYISWGWEQTNIDFYKVVKTTAKSISVLKVKSEYDPIANMVDNVTPIDEIASFDVFNPNHDEGKLLRIMTNVDYPSIKGHTIDKWNGQKLTATSYA